MTTMLTHPGTPAEMLADELAKQRRGPVLVNDQGNAVGEHHHRAKLTDHEVWLIWQLRAEGIRRRDIAEKMECSFYTVCEILAGRRRTMIATGQRRTAVHKSR
jgi:hypothetical protein